MHRVEIAARRLRRSDIPQDPPGNLQAFDGIGSENQRTAPSQLDEKAALEPARDESGEKEDPRLCGKHVSLVVRQRLDGRLDHPGQVNMLAVPQQRFVARQDLRRQRPLVESPPRGTLGRVRRRMHAPATQRRHRPAHRVAEARLLGQLPEAREAPRRQHLVDGALHQRVFVEDVHHREPGASDPRRGDLRREGARRLHLEADPGPAPQRHLTQQLLALAARASHQNLPAAVAAPNDALQLLDQDAGRCVVGCTGWGGGCPVPVKVQVELGHDRPRSAASARSRSNRAASRLPSRRRQTPR